MEARLDLIDARPDLSDGVSSHGDDGVADLGLFSHEGFDECATGVHLRRRHAQCPCRGRGHVEKMRSVQRHASDRTTAEDERNRPVERMLLTVIVHRDAATAMIGQRDDERVRISAE